MNTANSTKTVWVNTTLHRCTQMEDDTAYPIETLTQGRDARNKVPSFSMLAGEPVTKFELSPTMRSAAAAVGSMLAYAIVVACAYFKDKYHG